MGTAVRFRAAVEKGELAALDNLFTEDIRPCSRVRFSPFEGTAETSADGEHGPSAILLCRATVRGRQIHGQAVLAGLVADSLVPEPADR
ncbi:hypothetical protein [Streptomyces sp.]|uniref:hypothetical protein n=1 Tax=Streptomyces sp. TaxID=1931 RepID=UPI002D799F02|nr:hypothetical protein [Streptomyces sp.]HET6358265.1 hypothetical protein [Streptomyces sp.]